MRTESEPGPLVALPRALSRRLRVFGLTTGVVWKERMSSVAGEMQQQGGIWKEERAEPTGPWMLRGSMRGHALLAAVSCVGAACSLPLKPLCAQTISKRLVHPLHLRTFRRRVAALGVAHAGVTWPWTRADAVGECAAPGNVRFWGGEEKRSLPGLEKRAS